MTSCKEKWKKMPLHGSNIKSSLLWNWENFSVMNFNRSCSFQGFYCLFVTTGYDCSYLATFSLIPLSSSLTQKPQQSHKRIGWDYLAPLHQNDLPRGRFDWLKHGITASMAIFYAEEWKPTAMHQRSRFIIHIYTCSLWNIYTFTLFIYVLLLIYSPLAVFFIYVGRFACCVFLLLSYSFFAAHLVEKSSRELVMEVGGKEKERDSPNSKLYKDFLEFDFFFNIFFLLFEETYIV